MNIRRGIIYILLEKIRGKRRFVGQLRHGMGHSARGANVSQVPTTVLSRFSNPLDAIRKQPSAAFWTQSVGH
jgi:hypothetical protein